MNWPTLMLSCARVLVTPIVPILRSWYPEVRLERVCLSTAALRPGTRVRLVLMADLHAGVFHRGGEYVQVARLLRDLAPDLVVIGGDFVSDTPRGIAAVVAALEGAIPPQRGFYVFGNHDGWVGRRHLRPHLDRLGLVELSNRGVRLEVAGNPIWLCGLQDRDTAQPDLAAALDGRQPGDYTVLLTHHPDEILSLGPGDADLALAGHTHGGQVRICGRPLWTNSTLGIPGGSGLLEHQACTAYVTAGVGSVGVPVRIGVPPEIVLISLEGSDPNRLR
jgi:predicted MPP superfamily phosphohydrolase